jgi:uncharacterized delta-60 repeat protein
MNAQNNRTSQGLFRQGIGLLIALFIAACGDGSGGDGADGSQGVGSGPPSVGGGGGEGGIGTAQIDRSFGTSGGTITPIGGGGSAANAVVVQPDDRIVLVGISDGTPITFALSRYSAAGTLDDSFGAGGKVVSVINNPGTIGSADAIANAVALQGDGRIVVAGTSVGGGGDDFVLARYNTDGTPDAAFGSAGAVVTSLNAGNDRAFAMAVQDDQKIVVAGEAGGTFALARYNGNGTLDTSFGSDGVVLTDAGPGVDQILSMVLQGDGKIVVAGSSGGALALARYQTNGLLDPAFGGNGIVLFDRTAAADAARALILHGDGIVVGVSTDGTDNDFVLLRYTSAGILDSGFGLSGVVVTDLSGDDQINGLAAHPSGKITAVGVTRNAGDSDFAVAGYTENGTLDLFFGAQGRIVTPISAGGDDEAQAVAIQGDGKIVVAGSADFDFVVVRYLAAVPFAAGSGVSAISFVVNWSNP